MTYEVAIILGLGAITFIFAYLSVALSKEHGVLQFLFLGLVLFFSLTEIEITRQLAEYNNQTGITNLLGGTIYPSLMWASFLVIVYFVLYFVLKTVMGISYGGKTR